MKVLNISIGLLSGFLISAGLRGNRSLALLTGLPTSVIGYSIAESRSQKSLNSAISEKNHLAIEVQKLSRTNRDLTEELNVLSSETGDILTSLRSELLNTRQALEIALQESQSLRSEQTRLTTSLDGLKTHLSTAIVEKNDALEALEFLREGLDETIQEKAHDRFLEAKKAELSRVYQETESVMGRSIELFERLQSWGEKVAESHEAKIATIRGMSANYNQVLGNLETSVNEQISGYLEEIEGLQFKVATLQQQQAGVFTEPKYFDAAYGIETNIANDLCRLIFQELLIPLEVQGVRSKNGVFDIGFGYSSNADPEKIVAAIGNKLKCFQEILRVAELHLPRKFEAGNLILIGFRREPKVKTDDIKAMVGTPEQFLKYVTSNPWRYRLIADPGAGKSPTTAVMVSALLKAGAFRGNVAKAAKVPHTLIDVSYPGAMSSLKDGDDYPLAVFLKYGDNAAAVKSFGEAIADWEYRKQNPQFAEQFFHLWVWDELDNTITSSSSPQKVGTQIKELLKQGGHANIGYIVSGQSAMTKNIPGFMDDDRSLFTEIIIGVPKIRMYLEKYGKKYLSDSVVLKLAGNLDDIEKYIETQNSRITDSAREYRLALVLDSRSPKLYFLPCLDDVDFDFKTINNSQKLSEEFKRSGGSVTPGQGVVSELTGQVTSSPEILTSKGFDPSLVTRSETTIGGAIDLSDPLPFCNTCNVPLGSERADKRRKCPSCKKLKSPSRFIWK